MNYRHAFHAGNFADVVKHAILARVLTYMMQKPAPLRYLETHAGVGLYDLGGEEASRTGEWRDGIGRLDAAAAPAAVQALLAPYLDAVGPRDEAGRPRLYPGSPALAQHLLRAQDRLVLCELHPADAEALRANMGRDKRVKTLLLDGYVGLNANVPPPERRGLVLIDPPFESREEFEAMLTGLLKAYRKWPGGTYMLWYPIKDRAGVARFGEALAGSGLRRILQLHIFVRSDESEGPLGGCGLIVVNPPFTLEAEARLILAFLADVLAQPGAGHWVVRWLAGE